MPSDTHSETSASRGGWPEIEPSLLEDGRPTVPSFPLDVLPQPWRGWVADTAHGAGTPDDYVAQSLLSAVAGLCGAGVRAQVTSAWSEPLVLWQALVGAPSSGRTSALETIRQPLATIEKLLQRDGGACPERSRGTSSEQRVVTADAAFAALAGAVKARPAGVLLWRDDPSAWPAGLGRDTKTKDDARGWFLDAWSARAPTACDQKLAVSIVGSLHAERLGEALEDADDGLAARFLFSWPSPPPWRPLAEAKPAREDEAVTMLHRLAGAVGTPEKPLVLAFEEEALKAFDRFQGRLYDEVRRAEGLQAGWLGRGRGTIPRLAAALALLAWSDRPGARLPRVIGRDQLQAAIRLWRDYFQPHARAVFDRGAPSTQDRQTRRVIHWLQMRKASEVSREDVRRSALCQSVAAAAADQVIFRLEGAGILRALREEPFSRSGRPARRWQVNPALLLPAVAEIAQTSSDAVTADAAASPPPTPAG
jgi:hypothetical protein